MIHKMKTFWPEKN